MLEKSTVGGLYIVLEITRSESASNVINHRAEKEKKKLLSHEIHREAHPPAMILIRLDDQGKGKR